MNGSNTRGLHRLGDIRIDIVELRFAQLYIYAAQNIDRISYRLPVKGGVVVNFQIQVSVQRFYGLPGTAAEICLVDFIIISIVVNAQVRIPEHADQLDLSRLLVYIADDNYVCHVPLAYGIVPAVYAKKGHRPVAFHHLFFCYGNIGVGHLLRIPCRIDIQQGRLLLDIPHAEERTYEKAFCHNHGYNAAAQPLHLLLCGIGRFLARPAALSPAHRAVPVSASLCLRRALVSRNKPMALCTVSAGCCLLNRCRSMGRASIARCPDGSASLPSALLSGASRSASYFRSYRGGRGRHSAAAPASASYPLFFLSKLIFKLAVHASVSS